MNIRKTTDADLSDILLIEKAAFQRDSEAELTRDLLSDPTAEPRVSLIVTIEDQPVGHILFSNGHLENHPEVKVSFLAPLAVLPKFQKQGIGGALVKKGLEYLEDLGVDLVFVLGWPDYYPRFGFKPAGKIGLEAFCPIPEKDADAWMVKALRQGLIGSVSGKLIPCDALSKPELWRE
jgi:putative acetyltransferase